MQRAEKMSEGAVALVPLMRRLFSGPTDERRGEKKPGVKGVRWPAHGREHAAVGYVGFVVESAAGSFLVAVVAGVVVGVAAAVATVEFVVGCGVGFVVGAVGAAVVAVAVDVVRKSGMP